MQKNNEQEALAQSYCEQGILIPADTVQGLSDNEKIKLKNFYVNKTVVNRQHIPLALTGLLDTKPEYHKKQIGIVNTIINGFDIGFLVEILAIKKDTLEVCPIAGDGACFWINKEQFQLR